MNRFVKLAIGKKYQLQCVAKTGTTGKGFLYILLWFHTIGVRGGGASGSSQRQQALSFFTPGSTIC